MAASAVLEVLIKAKDEASNTIKGLGGVAKTALGVGLGALAVGGAAVAGAFALATKEAMESQKVIAQTNAVIKSTGGAAGVSAKQVQDLAKALQTSTEYTDEQTMEGENLLLTFTKIGKDVFPAATETMLDMSAALGQDMKSSAIQLGKALNDPVQGITALRRVGVSFTDEQQKMIDKLVASGDVLGAQKMILKELQTEFGGSAKAAGQTFGGQLAILKNRVMEVFEGVGMSLLPILQTLMERVIVPLLPLIEEFGNKVQGWLSIFQEAETPLLGIRNVLVDMFGGEVRAVFDNIVAKFVLIRDTILDFVNNVIVPFVTTHAEEFKGAFIAIGAVLGALAIVGLIMGIVGAVTALVNPITLIIAAIGLLGAAWAGNWGGIRDKVTAVIDFIKPYIQEFLAAIQAWWAAHGEQVIATVKALWDGIKAGIQAVVDFIRPIVQAFLQAIHDWWQAHGDQVILIVKTLWEGIKQAVENITTIVKGIVAAFHAALHGDFTTFGEKLREVWDFIWEKLKESFQAFWDALKILVPQLIKSITDFFKNTDWGKVGNDLIQGISDGITAATHWVVDAIKNVAKAIWDSLVGFFQSKSPSMKMFGMGQNLMKGMQLGMVQNTYLPVRAANYAANQIGQASEAGVNQVWNLTVNNPTPSSFSDDFEIMKALSRI